MTAGAAAPQDASGNGDPTPDIGLPPPSRLFGLRLKRVGKLDIYNKIRAILASNPYLLAPFEMRQMLNPEEIRTALEMRMTRGLPLFEGIRNAVVVLPLMVTWFSLALAALAYQQTLSLPQKQVDTIAGQGLFQQWQEGFPLLQSVAIGPWHIPLTIANMRFRFSGVALLDVGIIVLLLLLTAIIFAIEWRAHWIGVKVAGQMEEQLAAFSDKSLGWNPDTKDGAPLWATKILNSVNVLAKTTSELPEYYMKIKDTYEWLGATLSNSKDNMDEMRKAQEQTAQDWQEMNGNLKKAIDSLLEIALSLNPDLEAQWRAMQTPPLRHGKKKLPARVRDWLGL